MQGEVAEVAALRAALAEQVHLLEATIEQLPSGVIIVGAPEGEVRFSNSRAREMLGEIELSYSSFEDTSRRGGIHPDGRPLGPDDYPGRRALRENRIVSQDVLYRRPSDGRLITVEAAASPVRDKDGAVKSVVVLLRDVTALRDQLEAEQRARREAEQTVKWNELLNGILGHDLRNPLSAIVTGAQLLAMAPRGEETVSRTAARIASSAARMTRMIEQLLDLTRLRFGGGLALQRQDVDLGTLARTACDELEAALPGSRIALETEGDVAGHWDGDRLLQVFSNLVANAIQHGQSGAAVTVRLDGRAADRVAVHVHNQGEVPPEVLPLLFAPVRGPKARRDRARGLGLGLYITRELVIAHGGSIDVLSSATAGTRVTFTLPRR